MTPENKRCLHLAFSGSGKSKCMETPKDIFLNKEKLHKQSCSLRKSLAA